MPFDGVELPQVTEALIAARARLERGWCQGQSHQRRWSWLGPRDHYCLTGAFEKFTVQIAELLHAAVRDLGFADPHGLSKFNDTHTKAEVLAVVDRAIAISRGEGRRPEYLWRNKDAAR
jgi:hypothetical protein